MSSQLRVEQEWRERLSKVACPTRRMIGRLASARRRFPRSSRLTALCAMAIHRAQLSIDSAAIGSRRRPPPLRSGEWLRSIERRYRRAEHMYKAALGLDPRDGRCWEGLAAILDYQERFDEAPIAARQALRLAKTRADAADAIAYLSRILAQQGKRRAALRWTRDERLRGARSSFARSTAREVRAGIWRNV